jgi:RNA-directed DNA polymerase
VVKFHRPTQPFGPYRYRKDGHWYLGTGPSKKSVSRVRQKIGEVLKPSNVRPWEEVRDQLNRVLRGWAAYFRQGTRLMAYRAVDHHVYTRVRLFLIRRHKGPRRGAGRYPDSKVFGTFGVLRLRSLHLSSLP